MSKSVSLFRFGGVCVGSGVLAGKRAAGFGAACGRTTVGTCRSSLSAISGVCAKLSWKKGKKRSRKRSPDPIARTRETAAVEIPPKIAETVAPKQAKAVPPPQETRTPSKKKGFFARCSSEVARKPLAKQAVRPVSRTVRFPKVTPKQISEASFSGAAPKVILTKAISDLERDEYSLRSRAVEALGRIRHPLSVQALAAYISSETSALMRKECVNALAEIELSEGIKAIERALNDPHRSVRLSAVMAFHRLAGPEQASVLLGLLQDEDEEVRRMAVCCIGWTQDSSLSARLIPLCKDPVLRVRVAAAKAMGQLGDINAVGELIDCLSDSNLLVREEAHRAIKQLTGKTMGESLPKDLEERVLLIARWRHWWRDQAVA